MIIGIIRALRELAVLRHWGKSIEPCPGKTWKQCYEHYEDVKIHYLAYHVKGEKSSRAISIQY